MCTRPSPQLWEAGPGDEVSVETFEEYAQKVFLPYISKQLEHVTLLNLVWDMYVADTLNASARTKRGKGMRQRVVASARIPSNR